MLNLRSVLILLFSLALSSAIKADNGRPATLVIDFDQCTSDKVDGTNADYSEIAATTGTNGRVTLSAPEGGYRNRPHLNLHSCTEGLNGTPAMCIGFDPFCTYTPSTSAAFRFDVIVSPLSSDPLQLEALEFYQKAPEMFSWINGQSGINNYPTQYGLRIFKNGQLIRDVRDIATTRDWRQEVFDFRGDPEFEVTTETVFNFELMAYCAAGIIGGLGTIWDLEDIKVTANCIGECAPLDTAGDISVLGGGTAYYGCVWTTQLQLTTTSNIPGAQYFYFIVDENQTIVDIISGDGIADLTQLPAGTYNAYGYVDLGDGLPMIGSQFDQLPDDLCLSISQSSVTIFINEPDGGSLMGGPFEFCNDDIGGDFIPANGLILTDQEGANTQWIITDSEGKEILGLPFDIYEFDFESSPPGYCLIWNLSYDGWIKNLEVGNMLSDLVGLSNLVGNEEIPACFDLSNSVIVHKNRLEPGVLAGGPFTFCTGDGTPDILEASDVMLSTGNGKYNTWVLTDVLGVNIIAVSDALNELDFDNSGRGNCTLWNLTHDEVLTDLMPGGDFTTLIPCSARSNFISITKVENNGGIISGGPFEFCTGDGLQDFITTGAITLENNSGANSRWLLADAAGTILTPIAQNYEDINLEPLTAGTCQLFHLSYDGPITGIESGENIINIDGCYSLSNALEIIKIDCTPLVSGTVTGGPYSFCTADGQPDRLTGLMMQGADGENNTWLITDLNGNLVDRFDNPASYDTETLTEGEYLVYHLTYDTGLTGLDLGQNIFTQLMGKFALSTPIALSRSNPQGGNLSANSPQIFCVGDGTEDRILLEDLTLTDNSGNNIWVVTDAQGQTILGLNENINAIDFDSAGNGQCLVYNLSYIGVLSGLNINERLDAIEGCHDLSNAITITRNEVDGGDLDNGVGFIQFCVGDGEPDFIPAGSITLTGNIGDAHQWVITNTSGTEVLALPDSPYNVDFDGFAVGNCVLWNVSSIGGLPDLQIGANLTELQGCSDRSDTFISIFRLQNTGGTLSGGPFTFCVQDGTPDIIPDGAVTVNDNTGANNQWLVVDDNGIITEAPFGSFTNIDFDMALPGTYTLYHLSYDGPISGLGDNLPLSALDGCFSLSDGISITNNLCPSLLDDIELYQVSATNTITLTNRGTEAIEVSEFWLSHQGQTIKVNEIRDLCGDNLICQPTEYLIFPLPFELDNQNGSIALHLESIHGKKLIKDFVQWGAMGQAYEKEAMAAGIWSAQTFAEPITEGMAITIDSANSDSAQWRISMPMACALTSTTEEGLTATASIYPNPAVNHISIAGLTSDLNYQYEIRNLMGQLITKGVYVSGQVIVIGDLISGSYLLRLKSIDAEHSWLFQKK